MNNSDSDKGFIGFLKDPLRDQRAMKTLADV
jgi:hypothetical protein